MTTTVVVQARMGSTRLPGKVLMDLGGRPMLRFMLDRLAGLAVDHLAVATSTLERDDPVATVAREAGVPVVRGSEADVLARFLQVLDEYPADDVVRLTADCPLVDPEILMATLALHQDSGADYTCNVLPRTYPKGLDVEVARSRVLRQAGDEAVLPLEREHVTPFLYRHPERFRLANHRNNELLGEERWTVDTADDLAFVQSVVGRLASRGTFRWREVLDAVGRRAVAGPGRLHLRPVVATDSAFLLALRNDPVAVKFSGTRRSVDGDEHESWFARALNNPGNRIWIGEVDDQAVGMVRIDVVAAVGEVSIAVAPAARGRGVAAELLHLLQRGLEGDVQVDALVAAIHPENLASQKAFRSAGFEDHGERRGQLLLRWSPRTVCDEPRPPWGELS